MATPNLFPVSNSATATSSMHILSAFKRSSSTTATATAAAAAATTSSSSVSTRRNTSPTSETARSSKSFSVQEERRPSLVVSLPSKLKIRRKKSVDDDEPVVDGEAAQRLANRFFALPSEILTQILSHLDRFDIYSIRRSFRTFNHVLNTNAFAISKHVLEHALLSGGGSDHVSSSYAPTVIYPPVHPCLNLNYLLTMLHRQRVIDRAIYHTLSFVQMKTYMSQGPTRDATHQFDRQKVIDAFQQPAWTMCHFLESYRTILLDEHSTHHATGKFWDCQLCTASTRRIIDSYPSDQVMPAYHFYQIVMMHFRAALRAPSSAGALERRLRGWGRSPTTDESIAIFTILGGMEEMSKMSMMQGSYGKRLELVTAFVDRVRLSAGSPGSPGGRIVVQSSRKGSIVSALPPVDHLTASLDPPFERLTQDHLDRLPARVDDFFFPLWQERIARDGLAKHGTDDASAFKWIHNITHGYYGDEEDDDDDESEEHEHQEPLPLT